MNPISSTISVERSVPRTDIERPSCVERSVSNVFAVVLKLPAFSYVSTPLPALPDIGVCSPPISRSSDDRREQGAAVSVEERKGASLTAWSR